MSTPTYKVGQLLENSIRQFAKIVSVKNGIYGLTGWTDRRSAEKSTVARVFVNVYGLRNASVKSYGKTESVKDTATVSKPETAKVVEEKPTKAYINKLSANDAKALCKKVTGVDAENGKVAKERLCNYYML